MIGRAYLARQATALLRFARATRNPDLAAFLVEKAALIKSQVDEMKSVGDVSPSAPDVERTSRSSAT
jgi:hypothetical protein